MARSEGRNSYEVSAKTRSVILDATEEIMRNEGYAAVSSRRISKVCGVNPQLVYYHFKNMDGLFLALFERSERNFLERHLQVITARNPLRTMWELNLGPGRQDIMSEYMALAGHHAALRKEMQRSAESVRKVQSAIIAKFLADAGVSQDEFPAGFFAFFLSYIPRAIGNETSMGISEGHAETTAVVERWLDKLDNAVAARQVALSRGNAPVD